MSKQQTQFQKQQKTTESSTFKESGGDLRSNEAKDIKKGDLKKADFQEKFVEKENFDKDFKKTTIIKETVTEKQLPPEKVTAYAEVTVPISTEKETKFNQQKDQKNEKIWES